MMYCHFHRFRVVNKVKRGIRDFCSKFPNTIIVSGATCVGKSDVALELCQIINSKAQKDICEIVIADAVQVYRHIRIGCTKPTPSEIATVPHHLTDFRELGRECAAMNAGDFVDLAMQVIRDIHGRGNTAVVVGGATMWLDWLLNGKPNAPKCPNVSTEGTPDVRSRAAALLRPFQDRMENQSGTSSPGGKSALTAIKAAAWADAVKFVTSVVQSNTDGFMSPAVQSERAATLLKLTPNNYKYLSRSLEIALTPTAQAHDGVENVAQRSGGLLDYIHAATETATATASLASFFLTSPDRPGLYRRIDRRCVRMLQAGLLTEVTDLLISGRLAVSKEGSGGTFTGGESVSVSASAAGTVAKSIGYRQSIAYLCSTLPDADADTDTGDYIPDMTWDKADIENLQRYVDDFTTASRNYARYQLQYFRDVGDVVWCQGMAEGGSGGGRVSVPDRDARTVARELAYWCDHRSCDRSALTRRQLGTGLLHHTLVECLPTSVVDLVDPAVLDEYILDLYFERTETLVADLAEELKRTPVRALVDQISQLDHARQQRLRQQGKGGRTDTTTLKKGATEHSLSATAVSLRAKEPTGRKSALRMYRSRYHDISKAVADAAAVNSDGAMDKQRSVGELESVLPALLLEIEACRRKLHASGLLGHCGVM